MGITPRGEMADTPPCGISPEVSTSGTCRAVPSFFCTFFAKSDRPIAVRLRVLGIHDLVYWNRLEEDLQSQRFRGWPGGVPVGTSNTGGIPDERPGRRCLGITASTASRFCSCY